MYSYLFKHGTFKLKKNLSPWDNSNPRNKINTYIVSGEAALSSVGRSIVGSICNRFAAVVRLESNVTTLRRISSFTESSKW